MGISEEEASPEGRALLVRAEVSVDYALLRLVDREGDVHRVESSDHIELIGAVLRL